MNRISKIIFVVTALGTLAACSATKYKERGFNGGYSESRINENTYRVIFEGNRYTELPRAADFAMLRSAELTLEKGYNFFAVTDEIYNASLQTYVSAQTVEMNSTTRVRGNKTEVTNSEADVSGGNISMIIKPSTIKKIVMYKMKPKKNGQKVFDAKAVAAELRVKYGLN